MYTKIKISGILEIVSGLHIGGSNAFSAIGAVDSTVVRDILTGRPMIPGSSLKGKVRTLLAKEYNQTLANKPADDDPKLLRLFGNADDKTGRSKTGRLLFSDMILENEAELRKKGVDSLTEIKYENTINRITAEANPRQIERVIRGSIFYLDLIYEAAPQEEWLEDEAAQQEDLLEDFEIIGRGLQLLSYDYLGGSGSRGYGRVKISGLKAEKVFGSLDEKLIQEANQKLS